MEKENISYTIPTLKFNIKTISSDTAHLWLKNHIHDAVEIVYVQGGEIYAHIQGENLLAKSGDIIFINSGIVHSIENSKNASLTYIQTEISEYDYPENQSTHLYSFVTQQALKPYCFMQGKNELSDIFTAIQREINDKKPYYELYLKAYIQLFLPFMLRAGIIAEPNGNIITKTDTILPVAQYIETNYMHDITLDMCSQIVDCSKYELCNKFKKSTGRTVVEYINYIRLFHAKKLLKENEISITEVALKTGFSSVQYFNRTFKKYNGISPKAYRKQI